MEHDGQYVLSWLHNVRHLDSCFPMECASASGLLFLPVDYEDVGTMEDSFSILISYDGSGEVLPVIPAMVTKYAVLMFCPSSRFKSIVSLSIDGDC